MTVYVHQAVECRVQLNPIDRNDKEARDWAIVTIHNIDFAPSGIKSLPPSLADAAGGDVSEMFVHAFNRSDFAKRKKRWAFVSWSGSIVTISNVTDDIRPTDPCGFPPIVQADLSMHEALEMADDLNRERYELARVPRLWTIAVRRPVEGGVV